MDISVYTKNEINFENNTKTQSKKKQERERENEWMNDRMNEWMNETETKRKERKDKNEIEKKNNERKTKVTMKRKQQNILTLKLQEFPCKETTRLRRDHYVSGFLHNKIYPSTIVIPQVWNSDGYCLKMHQGERGYEFGSVYWWSSSLQHVEVFR